MAEVVHLVLRMKSLFRILKYISRHISVRVVDTSIHVCRGKCSRRSLTHFVWCSMQIGEDTMSNEQAAVSFDIQTNYTVFLDSACSKPAVV